MGGVCCCQYTKYHDEAEKLGTTPTTTTRLSILDGLLGPGDKNGNKLLTERVFGYFSFL